MVFFSSVFQLPLKLLVLIGNHRRQPLDQPGQMFGRDFVFDFGQHQTAIDFPHLRPQRFAFVGDPKLTPTSVIGGRALGDKPIIDHALYGA